jgi:formylmethanofuran dehydrogenase subunit E
MVKCDVCGEDRATVTWRPEQMPVKLADDVEVTIMPHVPVISCEACGEHYTDDRGADIRDAAVQSLRVAYEAGILKGLDP